MTGTLSITGDAEADDLLNTDPLALLLGMLLDQQIPMERAFIAPLWLQQRLGRRLDAADIAAVDPVEFEAVFRGPPALHRFPKSMAARVQAACGHVVAEHGGDAAAIWTGAADGADLQARLRAVPGYGDEKARIFMAILAKRLGIRPAGWEQAAGAFADDNPRSVADIDGPESFTRVRAWSRRRRRRSAASRSRRRTPGPAPISKRPRLGATGARHPRRRQRGETATERRSGQRVEVVEGHRAVRGEVVLGGGERQLGDDAATGARQRGHHHPIDPIGDRIAGEDEDRCVDRNEEQEGGGRFVLGVHLVKSGFHQVQETLMSAETFRVSSSGQMSLPAAVRHRWNLDDGGLVDVVDLGFGVLTVPAGEARRLLDEILPADAHYAAVAAEDDPDLATT